VAGMGARSREIVRCRCVSVVVSFLNAPPLARRRRHR
jgi:hypothetical protein